MGSQVSGSRCCATDMHAVVIHFFVNRKERELAQEVEKQKARILQMNTSMESTKEAQRIVLETKESVMRSLLQQNVTMSQEVTSPCIDVVATTDNITNVFRYSARCLIGASGRFDSNS
jgi:hypothetical protein